MSDWQSDGPSQRDGVAAVQDSGEACPPEHPRDSPNYGIAVVDRALDILEILNRNGPASLSQIAADVGCTRTAAFRLLRTLSARGIAVQNGRGGAWRLGGWLAPRHGND